jgi:hypothetical protein
MSISTIKSKVRQLIGDNLVTVSDVFTYGSNKTFSLTESNAVDVTNVYKNNVEMGDSEVSFDTTNNKVTINLSLTSGDTIEVKYTCYQNYSDNEILAYIQAALIHLSLNNYYDFSYDSTDDAIYPEPELREDNLISIITSLLINPDNKSYRLPDISVNVPNDLPIHDKISKTIALFKKNTSGIFEIL